jgi:anthraniloyl-CoA monooxygenase
VVLTEPVAVSAEARITPDCSVLESERHAEAWKRIVARVHDPFEARFALQLYTSASTVRATVHTSAESGV